MANSVSYIYEIMDRYTGPLKKISNQTKKFSSVAGRAQAGMRKMGTRMNDMAGRAQNLQGALGALGLGAALVKVVSVSSKMEDAMADIGRVTDVSAQGLVNFEGTLEKLSESLGKSKTGLAQMAFEGGKLGIPIDKMESFLMMTSRTAIAFDMLDQEAGRAIGSIQAKMGLMGADSEKLLDSLNYLADTTSANGSRMINIVERMSGTFKTLELPPAVAAGFAGFADQVEVTSELASSGLNMMIRQMRKMPGMTEKLMADPVAAVNEQLERMAGMGPELRTRFMNEVFGAEASRFVEKAVSNITLFKETMDKAMSTDAAGSMQRELENQLNRSSMSFKKFKEIAVNSFEKIGDILIPFAVKIAKKLTPLIDKMGDFIERNPKFTIWIAGLSALAVAFTAVAAAGGLLLAALAPVVTILGTISFPFVLAIAGVVSAGLILIEMFKNWKRTGHPVLKFFEDIFDSTMDIVYGLGELFKPLGDLILDFGKLFGLSASGKGFFHIIGNAIIFALTPLKLLLKALSGTIALVNDLSRLDFSAAGETLKNTASDMGDILKEQVFGPVVTSKLPPESIMQNMRNIPLQSMGVTIPRQGPSQAMGFNQSMGVETSMRAANVNARQNLDVSGSINISATNGTKINNADINLDGGENIAYGR